MPFGEQTVSHPTGTVLLCSLALVAPVVSLALDFPVVQAVTERFAKEPLVFELVHHFPELAEVCFGLPICSKALIYHFPCLMDQARLESTGAAALWMMHSNLLFDAQATVPLFVLALHV